MNKNAARISLALFFVIFFIEILRTNSQTAVQFNMVSQNLQTISEYLFSRYVVPFELLSLVLVGGIIGMLYIAGKEDDV